MSTYIRPVESVDDRYRDGRKLGEGHEFPSDWDSTHMFRLLADSPSHLASALTQLSNDDVPDFF